MFTAAKGIFGFTWHVQLQCLVGTQCVEQMLLVHASTLRNTIGWTLTVVSHGLGTRWPKSNLVEEKRTQTTH